MLSVVTAQGPVVAKLGPSCDTTGLTRSSKNCASSRLVHMVHGYLSDVEAWRIAGRRAPLLPSKDQPHVALSVQSPPATNA